METPHGVDDEEVRLGRHLAAAFIATCHGIGLDYARKEYADLRLPFDVALEAARLRRAVQGK